MKEAEKSGVKLKKRLYPTIREEREQRKLREEFGIPENLVIRNFPTSKLPRKDVKRKAK